MKPPKYKSFPKYDARRYFCVLEAMVRLNEKATVYYMANDLEVSRSEIERAIIALKLQYGVQIEKLDGDPVYRLRSWGVLKQKEIFSLLESVSAGQS